MSAGKFVQDPQVVFLAIVDDLESVLETDGVVNLDSKASVLEKERLELSNVADLVLVESAWKEVACTLVRTISNLGSWSDTFVLTPHWAVNTNWPTPAGWDTQEAVVLEPPELACPLLDNSWMG